MAKVDSQYQDQHLSTDDYASRWIASCELQLLASAALLTATETDAPTSGFYEHLPNFLSLFLNLTKKQKERKKRIKITVYSFLLDSFLNTGMNR